MSGVQHGQSTQVRQARRRNIPEGNQDKSTTKHVLPGGESEECSFNVRYSHTVSWRDLMMRLYHLHLSGSVQGPSWDPPVRMEGTVLYLPSTAFSPLWFGLRTFVDSQM